MLAKDSIFDIDCYQLCCLILVIEKQKYFRDLHEIFDLILQHLEKNYEGTYIIKKL